MLQFHENMKFHKLYYYYELNEETAEANSKSIFQQTIEIKQ